MRIMSRKQSQKHEMNVITFFDTLIVANKHEKRITRATNYKRTLNSFSAFLDYEDISFSEMNEGMIKEYEKWLRNNGVTPNSSSFYIRNLRAVYNQAVKQGYAERSFMFENVYTGVDTPVSPRPAISEDAIARLLQLDLSYSPPLALSRDMFVFSYCTRGMAFKDIAFLRKSDIIGDFIRYTAHKSGKTETVRMELITKSIILKYAETTKDSDYVFPIITRTDAVQASNQYQIALSYHNRKLKRLGQMIGESIPLTHNVARNTWAKSAQAHNIPASVIGPALGIPSEKATQDFLNSISVSEADIANSTLLASLNNNVTELR